MPKSAPKIAVSRKALKHNTFRKIAFSRSSKSLAEIATFRRRPSMEHKKAMRDLGRKRKGKSSDQWKGLGLRERAGQAIDNVKEGVENVKGNIRKVRRGVEVARGVHRGIRKLSGKKD